ncbi:MAG: Y-family DNA polymerase [Prevotella sp.]|nr:Y-family DNA polymerase [Bacteroides sp.]MCM1365690.1 Y-family DNA polymerase [Prevotella sp.]MCM1437144.1 Y-family DNA polymerase [Prevotella sp.]
MMEHKRMWGLADCNNFFVSCERRVDRSLEGKAVVVLSNNDGCAIARSNEAKKLGIRMGQPAFELRDMINSGQLTALSGNHLLYRQISIQVHEIIARYVPYTLDYSVDESFIDASGLPVNSLYDVGSDIVNACRNEAGIPVTVGFASTKTLAKVATELGKKRSKSVNIMIEEEHIRCALENMPVGDIWGIGPRIAKRLYGDGVYTAFQYSQRPVQWVRQHYGVNGEKTWWELNGKSCIELSHVQREVQNSISETRTFPHDENDYDYLRSRIIIYASDCARRLRVMRSRCKSVTVLLRTNRFHTEQGYYAPQISVTLPMPVNDTTLIVEAALAGLDKIYDPRKRYKRGGVILSDITAAKCYTPSLFSEMNSDVEQTFLKRNRPKLMSAIDNINSIVGMPAIRLASQLVAGQPGHNDGYSSSFGAPDKKRGR